MKPLLFALAFALPALAEETDFKAFPAPNPFQVSGRVGVAVSGPSSVSGSDTRVPFLIGGGADYYFAKALGAFLEAHGTSRGFRSGGASASAAFLDVWLGIAFRTGGRWFAEDSMNLFKFGGFWAQPLGNYSGSLSPAFGNGTKGYFGLAYGQDILFPVGESLKAGFTIWGKLGLGDATRAATGIKFYEAGLGACVAFR
jgi:hypothetical protein